MSKGEALFRKESKEFSESDDDVWDDRKINDAYDKAIKIAGTEVAKRLAMSTNSKPGVNTGAKAECKPWKAGMPCRALYEGDGLEYEAIILRITNEEECVVRFLGYENSEIVPIKILKPSLGEESQAKQLDEACQENKQAGSSVAVSEHMECDYNRPFSPNTTGEEKSYSHKKKLPKKKNHNKNNNINQFKLPEMPAMPYTPMMQNLTSVEIPMPPPPPIALSQAKTDSEEQAISSMLLSWYMSGYYTGLYQGMKRAKENRNH